VGKERNDFGTRLCQRIECSRCQKVDYVAKKIAGAKTVYCRDCAERFLYTFESGRVIAKKSVLRSCAQCTKEFSMDEEIALKKDELLCRDCLKGFDTWRGKLASPLKKRVFKDISVACGAKTFIRKNNDPV
jgi:hypothetical protein